MARSTPRLPGEARKRQIVQAALRVMADEGIQGTTMARIAAGVGITEPSIYTHFTSRQEILLAALDLVFERVAEIHQSAVAEPDALERIRKMCRYHSSLVASENEEYLYPLFEFVAAPPAAGLREALGSKEMTAVKDVARIVDVAKEQGRIAADVDSLQLAGMIIGCSWTEAVAHLMGMDGFWNATRTAHMVDLILTGVSTGL